MNKKVKNELPKPYITILALLKFEDVPPISAVGFIAETTDTKIPYFHVPLFGGRGYDVSLIAKWVYLDEIAPEYAITWR